MCGLYKIFIRQMPRIALPHIVSCQLQDPRPQAAAPAMAGMPDPPAGKRQTVTLSYKIPTPPATKPVVRRTAKGQKFFVSFFQKRNTSFLAQHPVSPCATPGRPLATRIPYIVEPESPPYGARNC
jgi:predicted pyridoxine 5'-phosphate oxidase superfamily flavin-nucleotide-binding protein